MDWIYFMKVALLGSGALVLLAIAAFIFQLVGIARDIRIVVQRIEMITNYTNWIGWVKKIGVLSRFYEKFRH